MYMIVTKITRKLAEINKFLLRGYERIVCNMLCDIQQFGKFKNAI